jgi:pimeloyl-ACP methyl ester carboxylesterase
MSKHVIRAVLAATLGLSSIVPAIPARAQPAPTPSLTLGACGASSPLPSDAQCGTLLVPLDYAQPAGDQLPLRVVRVPATGPGTRIGALVVNPGGPGASGVQFVEYALPILAHLNERFDIVSWDPRGVSAPRPVHCATTRELDAYVFADPILDDPTEHADLVNSAANLASGCAQRSADLLPHVSTADDARDMDALRAALGEQQISYLGISYGTYLGTLYAARYPGRLRAAVLDGDVDPSLDPLQMAADQADSFEASFDYLVSWCDAEPTCAIYPDARALIDGVLSRLDTDPVTVNGRLFGRGDALLALTGMMYTPPAWPYYVGFWAAAARGDFTGLQALADGYTGRTQSGYDASLESGTAINCADADAPTDVGRYDAAAALTLARDPHFGWAAYDDLPCAFWPFHGAPAHPLDVRGVPPVLLVGALGDPATPYRWSVALHQQIEGSVLLTREGHGHPSYFLNSCTRSYVDTYLFTGQTPPDGTVCPPG